MPIQCVSIVITPTPQTGDKWDCLSARLSEELKCNSFVRARSGRTELLSQTHGEPWTDEQCPEEYIYLGSDSGGFIQF